MKDYGKQAEENIKIELSKEEFLNLAEKQAKIIGKITTTSKCGKDTIEWDVTAMYNGAVIGPTP